ncbi:hypothetical protein ACFH04_00305 [Streptomyces noboritoensis]|uniref:Uncharacterized protein n=1 Tax=Streptomyces noboritoensis TaxID=67337 RepID=A0ABV6T8U4_9ACTN
MRSWDSLTITEQALMRRAMAGGPLAGTVQDRGVALRWAGVEDAPPHPRAATPMTSSASWSRSSRPSPWTSPDAACSPSRRAKATFLPPAPSP